MTHPFIYEQVAQDIRSQILTRTLAPGDKLPSLRHLSKARKISVSTVMQAYLELEAEGLILARPQSGFYVAPPQHLPEPKISHGTSEPLSVGQDQFVAEILASARRADMVPLGLTSLSPDILPIARLNRLMNRLAQAPEAHTYEATQGNLLLRRQIARRALETHPLNADDVLITSGCMEALNLALRAVAQPGDTIAVEMPTYYGTLRTIEGLGLKVLEIPAHPRLGMDLSRLEQALETYPIQAVLTIPTFHNPLGYCMPLARKQALVELVTRRQIPIIEDDIFGEFYFGSAPPTLYALDANAENPTGLVILCSSFSKTLAPGYRVGWALPGRYREQMIRLKRMTSLVTATLPQMTIAEFMQSGAYERYLRKLRKQIALSVSRGVETVVQHFPGGTRLSRPQGGFILWVELPEQVSAMALYEKALAVGITLAPGPMFSAQRLHQNCIRLSLNLPWSERLENSLITLGQIVAELMHEVKF